MVSPLHLSNQRISAFSPKLQTLSCLFKSPAEVWTSSSLHIFCLWLVIGTYILPGFFPIICWSYLQMEISVTLPIGNKLYSRHHILYFSFQWKPLCWCYLVTALNLLSSSLSAKLVYHYITILKMVWPKVSYIYGLNYLRWNTSEK